MFISEVDLYHGQTERDPLLFIKNIAIKWPLKRNTPSGMIIPAILPLEGGTGI
jgi:hypothetical protein